MRVGIRIFIFAICTAFAAASAAQADGPTFADLLARAKAQAAAGHRSTPPGDNMIETIAGMVDLASTATPTQLEELVALLESDKPVRLQPQIVPPPLPKIQPAPPAPSKASVASLPSPAITSSAMPLTATPANPPSGAAGTATPQGSPRQEPADMAARATALFARGQAAEAKGDISGARRLYGSAAEAGNAAAARSLGRLYDPAYLRATVVGGVDADPVLARSWYERAIKMGDPNAGSLLNALSTR